MPSRPNLSILQISDLHILPNPKQTLLGIETEHYFLQILEHAFNQNIRFDLILITGDLTQEPCISSYQRIADNLEKYAVPAICLPGNHDDFAMMQQVYNSQAINCRKQSFHQSWQLICLNSQVPDSQDGNLSDSELDFLERCLADQPNYHALVAVHHHCLPSGSAWLDTMQIKNSAALLTLINQYPQLKLITHGHVHQEMDYLTQNIRILAAPSTCFQFKPNNADFCVSQAAPGYRIIHLHQDGSFSTEVKRLPEELAQIELSNIGY